MKKIMIIALITFLLLTFNRAQAQHKHQDQQAVKENTSHEGHKKTMGVESLSHVLRHLLIQEMQALQTGMMSIIPAYVSGNWTEIESTANKMNNSYILKQNLTESQMHEMHSVLPQEFIEKDQRFHYLAGMLEHAAKSKKPEPVSYTHLTLPTICSV